MTSQATPDWSARIARHARWFLVACAVLAALLMVQGVAYWGLIEWLGELQFAVFRRYFPALTLALLVLLFGGLWMGVAWLRRRIRDGDNPPADEQPSALTEIGRLASLGNFLFVTSAIAGLLALGTFIHYLRLPDGSGPPRVVTLPADGAVLPEGPVHLRGATLIGPVGRYAEDIAFSRHIIYLAPVAAGRDVDGAPMFTLFVEVDRPEINTVVLRDTGVLQRKALRPEVREMYRLAGYRVADHPAMLFRSAASANRDVLVLMGEFIIFGLIALIFAFITRRVERRHRRQVEGDDAPAPANSAGAE